MRQLAIYFRAKRVKDDTALRFDGIVHNCCGVSGNNHQLAFIIHREGVFGYPRVESLRRPDIVQLSETDDCVIVKDGYMYELKKETR